MTGAPWEDRFLQLLFLGTILSAFFALLWREGARDQKRFFVRMWLAIVVGSLAAAWAMSLAGGR